MNSLYTSEPFKNLTVKNVSNVPLLASLGIFVGSNIIKKHTFNAGGPVLVSINSREIAIGKDYAKLIEVE